MDLSDVIPAQAILLAPESEHREDVIAALLERLARCGALDATGAKKAKMAIEERERKGSTAVGGGLAIPHARVDFLSKPVGAFARLRDGEGFASIDAGSVHYMFLILSPTGGHDTHLQTLGAVTRLVSDLDSRARLDSCASPEEMREFFAASCVVAR